MNLFEPSAGRDTAFARLIETPRRYVTTAHFRLTLIFAVAFSLSVAVLFGVIYWTAGSALRKQAGETVMRDVALLRDVYKHQGEKELALEIESRSQPSMRADLYYRLQSVSKGLIAGNFPEAPAVLGWSIVERPLPESLRGEDKPPSAREGYSVFLYGVRLSGDLRLWVGYDNHPIFEAQEAIVRAFIWAFAVTIVLALTGGMFLSWRFLKRIDDINRTLKSINALRLNDRFTVRGSGDELDRLALNLNAMLERIQHLMDGMRQVSSDVAHDLKTPLSRLRQRLEAAQRDAKTAADYDAAIQGALDDADGILTVFATLLRIAQIEAGGRRLALGAVDLSTVCSAIADAYAAVAEDKNRDLTCTIDSEVAIRGDRDMMMQALVNLLENALNYSPPGGRVHIALRKEEKAVSLCVFDDGPGIPPDERDNVFRRFYRLERSRSTPGSGLGLAIVKAVSDLHGARIVFKDDDERGFGVCIRFQGDGFPPLAGMAG
ncbi:sensor histidine kinase [Varunaivibrio sulfuroxidans]|uniref:histidine kinase n=1 Tax=Varunaivibrio sulfuroxidans TaxID=1773489 RepID=A0A4R3JAP3_9PROT|nr:HAMP domain-containing sensor histidine kinase [Varunaivibrio sulfuroxidans]TCS62093.1 signal transduction histidine kinase [Varunaivibrio sulfuroxidans]WES30526.1 HAMP domain-containing sensor histidine kinase [Varunaivibrio sulfuroxidans]